MTRKRQRRQTRQRQPTLTPAQQAAAKSAAERFDEACVQAHLSTEPVDEQAAEAYLRQAYERAGQAAPQQIHWLAGPCQLVAALASKRSWLRSDDTVRERISPSVWDSLRDNTEIGAIESGAPVLNSVDYRVTRLQIYAPLRAHPHGLNQRVWEAVRERVGERIWQAVADEVNWPLSPWIRDSIWGNDDYAIWHSTRAYDEAPSLALAEYLGRPLALEKGRALAFFNQMVAGYWCGKDVALVVRKPRLLAFDDAGRLHSATGRCVEYLDGWGFFAWHGVPVSERVILEPDTLTREDFLGERNVEARRVIQERMGAERFVWELAATFIDGGAQGVLYEVALPDDTDEVARYVQVLDPSTGREYYLRVPPTIASAEAAVAWTFALQDNEYDPREET
jgi:hypothetical protein